MSSDSVVASLLMNLYSGYNQVILNESGLILSTIWWLDKRNSLHWIVSAHGFFHKTMIHSHLCKQLSSFYFLFILVLLYSRTNITEWTSCLYEGQCEANRRLIWIKRVLPCNWRSWAYSTEFKSFRRKKTVDSNRTVSLYAVNAFHWFNIVVLLLSFPISIIVSKTVTISIVIVAVY